LHKTHTHTHTHTNIHTRAHTHANTHTHKHAHTHTHANTHTHTHTHTVLTERAFIIEWPGAPEEHIGRLLHRLKMLKSQLYSQSLQ